MIPWNELGTTLSTTLRTLQPGDAFLVNRFGLSGDFIGVARGGSTTSVMWAEPRDVGIALAFRGELKPYEVAGWGEAITFANEHTLRILTLTAQIIPKLFAKPEDGGIDATKSVAGPIALFSALKDSVEQAGFAKFLHFLALIGLNLFIINLLPIPIVDGGQLLFVMIEAVIRRPVPPQVVDIANRLGFALILSVMIFVLGNDILNQLVR